MTTEPTIIGIDLGKNWFHLIGIDARGATVLRKKLNRGQLAAFAVTAPRAVVATEACAGSQYWGRVFSQAGHDVRLLPAQFVKPYVKANKNDFHDAAAIAEAASRASMRCVPLKTTEQLELQALHRMRQRAVRERTAVVNQMRALLLEHGIVVPVGRDLFARRLPATFADAERCLSPRLLDVLHRLRQRWLAIDGEVEAATHDLTVWAGQSDLCQRLVTVPGIGPLIATATVAAVWCGTCPPNTKNFLLFSVLNPRSAYSPSCGLVIRGRRRDQEGVSGCSSRVRLCRLGLDRLVCCASRGKRTFLPSCRGGQRSSMRRDSTTHRTLLR